MPSNDHAGHQIGQDVAAALYLTDGDQRRAAMLLAEYQPINGMGLEMSTAWWFRKVKEHV